MDHKDVERIVLAVANEYDFSCWRAMFRQSDRFTTKEERNLRKEATTMCALIASRYPMMTQITASQTFGHTATFVNSLSKKPNGYEHYSADFYARYDRITKVLKSDHRFSLR